MLFTCLAAAAFAQDLDEDGVLDGDDNCPTVANPPTDTGGEQADADGDGFSVDDDRAWGSFSAGALGGSAGERVELGPQPLPIWCPTLL